MKVNLVIFSLLDCLDRMSVAFLDVVWLILVDHLSLMCMCVSCVETVSSTKSEQYSLFSDVA
jgi:hypothetical protein